MALDRFPGILESPCLPVCRGVFNSGNLSTGCTPTPAPFGPDRRAQLDGVGGMTAPAYAAHGTRSQKANYPSTTRDVRSDANQNRRRAVT